MIEFAATPIGNLKDITVRALEALRAADAVFCEDTRVTVRLLSAYDLKKPLYACHKFNEREAAHKMIALSREGKRVVVVSDAGMPAISDPGREVCRILQEEGEPYTVLPGANAALCALVLSAFPSDRFTFVGFLPPKGEERTKLAERYENARETLLCHCAPQDVPRDVDFLFSVLGDREACLVREISKLHEETVFFRLSEGCGEARGECVLVVKGAEERENPLNALSPREHIKRYMDEGLDKKEALKRAARDRGVPKSALYRDALDL